MAAVERIFDILPRQLQRNPLSTCLSHKVNGEWKRYSTQEVIDIVNKVSGGLLKLSVKPDDKVAIAASNRPEWNFIDLATQQIGAVPVPIYPTMSVENYEYICGHAEVKVAFVEDQKLFDKITEATNNRPLDGIYTFNKLEGAAHWETMLDHSPDLEAIQKLKDAVKVDDLLTLIYTSGTTGTPKGVMLTHRNIYTNM
ncbi:MAG: AMP-binding protein, partial [Bacteroidota bacterium]